MTEALILTAVVLLIGLGVYSVVSDLWGRKD